jgi:uncharacterized protein (DUF1778 family)
MARKKAKPPAIGTLDARIDVRFTAEEKEQFLTAAQRQGLTLSQWMRLAAWLVLKEHDGKVKLKELG